MLEFGLLKSNRITIHGEILNALKRLPSDCTEADIVKELRERTTKEVHRAILDLKASGQIELGR